MEQENQRKEKRQISIDIKNNKIVQYILAILFSLSVACMTCILIEESTNKMTYIVLFLMSFVITGMITLKFNFLKNTFQKTKIPLLLVSICLGIYTTFYLASPTNSAIEIQWIKICVIFAIPAVSVFLYWFYNHFIDYMKKYTNSLEKIEKRFLISAGLILSIMITIIYQTTDVFYKITTPEENYDYQIRYIQKGENAEEMAQSYIKYLYHTNQYDIIYTSDTAPLVREDAYTHIVSDQNDIRQPLFGLSSLPFYILPRIVANIFPSIDFLYATMIAIIQVWLILIAFTMLSKMMKIENKITKILFLIALTISYPTMLFMLNLEQYAMSIFYVISFIYMAIQKGKEKDMLYIAATGSMLTSGILFPLLGQKGNLKQSIKQIGIAFFKCMAIFIIFARITLIFPQNIEKQIGRIRQYSNSEYTTMEKLNMYTNFCKNTHSYSEFNEVRRNVAVKMIAKDENKINITITMPTIKQINTTSLSLIGCIIIIIAVLGFILNRKDCFSKICFTWSVFSFILLFLLGWGTNENGLILYTFYFGWAFLCLGFQLFEKILKNKTKLKNIILSIGILGMAGVNIYGIYQTILFGIKNFPC